MMADYLSPANTLFGLPLSMRRVDLAQLIADLSRLWEAQHGAPPGRFELDISLLQRFFDPNAKGASLRNELARLPAMPPVSSRYLRPPLVAGESEPRLVSPEGRIFLAVAKDLDSQDEVVTIPPDLIASAYSTAYGVYRGWGQRRLADVLRLPSGTGHAAPAPSLAVVLLLLVNGSRSVQTSITRPEDSAKRLFLDDALAGIGLAFCSAMGVANVTARSFSLYSGFAWSEARRRLPTVLGPEAASWYLRSGTEAETIEFVVSETLRPRRRFNASALLEAFDAMVAAYRTQLPTLASLGLAHENPIATRRHREMLEQSIDDAARRP